MEDQEIIALFFARSEQALDETAKKYSSYCRSIAANILQDPTDVDECVNDAYWKLWQQIPPHEPSNFKAFLGTLVRNHALDTYRSRHAAKRNHHRCDPIDEIEACLPSGSEASLIDSIVLTQLLNRFLGSLAEKDRIIFLRRYWYFCSVSEIAAMGGLGQSRVKMSLHRSRKALRKLLEKEGFYRG